MKLRLRLAFAAAAFAALALLPSTASAQKWGDVNGDGVIGAVDAQAILTAVVGLSLPASFTAANGDANCDGKLGAVDAQIVLSFVVGLNVSQFCVGTPVVVPVAVTLGASTITVGATTQATAVIKDANGAVLTGQVVTWSSGTTTVATVNTTGVVTGVGGGTSVITATSNGKTGTATVTVVVPLGFGSSIEKIRILDVASTFSPTLTGATTANVTFVSRATSIATVDAQGQITAVGEGQVWVAAVGAASADSVYVIVPRSTTGPVFRTDLKSFNANAGTISFSIILDARGSAVGGGEVSVGIQTNPLFLASTNYQLPTGTGPTPLVSKPILGVYRLSFASATALTGLINLGTITLGGAVPTPNASIMITLNLYDLVSATGTDILPTATSTRIPIIVR